MMETMKTQVMKTWYIRLKAVDNDWFGEYEFYDTVEGTPEDLEEALKSWDNAEDVTVLEVTEGK